MDDQGRPLYSVALLAISSEGPEIINVKFGGENKGLDEMTPVKVTNLVATTWAMGDRTGVSFKADQIELKSKAAA